MKVLLLGGTGLISTSITQQLLELGHDVTHYNRGTSISSDKVRTIRGDRYDYANFERQMEELEHIDCVIDMIGFRKTDVESAIRAFRGRGTHYIFCSTVDVYSKRPASYPISEEQPRNPKPSFSYAFHKAMCEEALFEAHDNREFPVTVCRPALTYGGTGHVVASIGDGIYQMKRIRQGKPIIVHGDGTNLWSACHRDDVARAFVAAIQNPLAFGKAYNVTGEEWFTFDRYWETIASALGSAEPQIVHVPSDLLATLLPEHATWCVENFRYNNVYDNTRARDDLGFRYTLTWEQGVREVIRELDKIGGIEAAEEPKYYDELLAAWKRAGDTLSQAMAPFRK